MTVKSITLLSLLIVIVLNIDGSHQLGPSFKKNRQNVPPPPPPPQFDYETEEIPPPTAKPRIKPPVIASIVKPVPRAFPQPEAEPIRPILRAMPEPPPHMPEPMVRPIIKPMPEPMAEPMPKPIQKPFKQMPDLMPEPFVKPIIKVIPEPPPPPHAEPLAKQLVKPMMKPMSEPMAEPMAKKWSEPSGKQVAYPSGPQWSDPTNNQWTTAKPMAEPMLQPISPPAVKWVVTLPKPSADPMSQSMTPSTEPNKTVGPIDWEAEKEAITKNMKKQYEALKTLAIDYKRLYANETRWVKGLYKDFSEVLTWYFSDPTENETLEIDHLLENFYPFGGEDKFYIDTPEKMDQFCENKKGNLDRLRSWVRRKHRFIVPVQVGFNMIIDRIEDQTEFSCNSTEHRKEYLLNMNKIKPINRQLVPGKERLLDAAVYLQNTTYKVPQLGRLCCALWDYLGDLAANVKETPALYFAMRISQNYFYHGSKYLCYLYPIGSTLCQEEPRAPKVPHKYKSILMELLLTLSEIVHI